MLADTIQWGNRELQRRSILRMDCRSDQLKLSELGEIPLPEKLEVGRPRDARKLRLKDLRGALRQAGIHWLREPEARVLP